MDNKEPKGEPILPIVDARWQVRAFAEEMEIVLKRNDHKGGWRESPIQYLQSRLVEEMGEYFALIAEGKDKGLTAQKELLDIANFCMMLWDRA